MARLHIIISDKLDFTSFVTMQDLIFKRCITQVYAWRSYSMNFHHHNFSDF